MNPHRPINQADLDTLDEPIGGTWYCEERETLASRIANMSVRTATGLILLIAVVFTLAHGSL